MIGDSRRRRRATSRDGCRELECCGGDRVRGRDGESGWNSEATRWIHYRSDHGRDRPVQPLGRAHRHRGQCRCGNMECSHGRAGQNRVAVHHRVRIPDDKGDVRRELTEQQPRKKQRHGRAAGPRHSGDDTDPETHDQHQHGRRTRGVTTVGPPVRCHGQRHRRRADSSAAKRSSGRPHGTGSTTERRDEPEGRLRCRPARPRWRCAQPCDVREASAPTSAPRYPDP
jgi:hypothetical protein